MSVRSMQETVEEVAQQILELERTINPAVERLDDIAKHLKEIAEILKTISISKV